MYIRLPAEDRQEYGEDKVGRLFKSMCGTQDASHFWQLDYVTLICESWEDSEETHTLQPCSTTQMDCEDWQCKVTTLCVCQTKTGSNTSTKLLTSKPTAKDMGTLGSEDTHAKSRLLLNRVFRVGTDQTGQYVRHALPKTKESGCKANIKTVNTPREKLQDKLVSEEGRCNTIQICVHETLLILAQDGMDLAETRKHMAQRMSEPRDFDFVPLKRAPRYLVGKPKLAIRFRRQKTC